MPPFTRRELVLSALSRGKEQSKRYEFAPTATAAARFGTVAVRLKNKHYYILICEVWSPSNVDSMEWDVDDKITLPDLAAVEELLATRLGLQIEELGPSRGSRHFLEEE